MAQVVAVTLIRRYRPGYSPAVQMAYPVTSVVAFAGWAFILGPAASSLFYGDLRWQHSASSRTYGGAGTTGMAV